MTNQVESKMLGAAQVAEWLSSARTMMGDELADMMEAHLLALSPPTPEDVARGAEEAHASCTACAGKRVRTKPCTMCHDSTWDHECNDEEVPCTWPGHDIIARLRDGAARAQGLEARVESLLAEHAITLSERDAARQAAARLQEEHDHWERTTRESRERVATLDRDLTNHKTAVDGLEDLWGQQKARAEAAERRVAELVTACEQLERRYLSEAKGYDEPLRTAYRYGAGVAKVLGAVARDAATPATHPAPAGLLEAVGPLMQWARAVCVTYPPDYLGTPLDLRTDLLKPALTLDFARTLLAAYAAAKGGEAHAEDRTLRHLHAIQQKARKWDAAVERCKAQVAEAQAARNRVAANAVEHAVTWVLYGDTPPSGPGGGEKDPRAETLEDFRSGVGLPSAPITPTPTPERPALTCDCGAPATCSGQYEGHGGHTPACDDCCGHGNEDGHCKPIVPTEPAVPCVVWEGDGVRVYADGTWATWTPATNEWLPNAYGGHRANPLARALAEAKRENADLQTEVTLKQASLDGHSRDYRDARKAAEDMRERCAVLLDNSALGAEEPRMTASLVAKMRALHVEAK